MDMLTLAEMMDYFVWLLDSLKASFSAILKLVRHRNVLVLQSALPLYFEKKLFFYL